mmetsp:Transcript_5055/g.10243  ORF Transcript_5055/g.10243 Transcript_5055/m.10243 type:complete len:225 (-) Transcript_5055:286-960(-)|eukprot:CAMPEP_0184685568 /NCGR_PEP_ID=MMETSP0312-20130426/19468_1 /TAXON_ID=31354 /ORGANISM="Compsopogon coeruleus, Strain SAG 36.94" /LENGTH=224 /DNA_ID=CAMNT_0027139783 /DNA_START=256 /DNA_END=930 /DNA_ORIENTATION=+
MAEENQTDSVSKGVELLCVMDCGFYGTAQMMNMCSKCFSEHQKREDMAPPNIMGEAASPALDDRVGRAVEKLVVSEPISWQSESGVGSDNGTSSKVAVELEGTPNESLIRPDAEELAAVSLKGKIEGKLEVGESNLESLKSTVVDGDVEDGRPPPRKVQKKPGRCFSCKKKVGLTGFPCRCGYVYCSLHRYADAHDCEFDYKTSGRELLKKANPIVVASKFEKI